MTLLNVDNKSKGASKSFDVPVLDLAGGPKGKDTLLLHDLPQLTLWADRPTALQLDGEPVGERMSVHLQSHPEALTVLV